MPLAVRDADRGALAHQSDVIDRYDLCTEELEWLREREGSVIGRFSRSEGYETSGEPA